LGTTTDTGGAMGPPNGEMDPWADSAEATARFWKLLLDPTTYSP
jgi:hypothetical protein